MRWTRWFAASLVAAGLVQVSAAQEVKPTRGGFDTIVKLQATGEERNNQPNLWVFEIQMKSLRMLELPVIDAKTGTKKNEVIHYLVYKAINRELERNKDDGESVPVNVFDAPPGPDIFAPSALLVTEDNGKKAIYKDEIYHDAQAAIERREKIKLLNSVQAMKPVPEASPATDPSPASAYYGVMIFKNVDADADYYTIYLTGFSNGYKLVKGPVAYSELSQLATDKKLAINNELWNGKFNQDWRAAGDSENLFDNTVPAKPGAEESQWYYSRFPDAADDETIVWRKTLMMKYWRPGDRHERFEGEIRMQGNPVWIYRPDEPKSKTDEPKAATALKVDIKRGI